ncbi:flavodoxin [Oerskovia enterophila]|uniref:flavodoxin n=1 Tax=Oerskovia enterophila TaxID=43678 RepID=UPI003391EB6B
MRAAAVSRREVLRVAVAGAGVLAVASCTGTGGRAEPREPVPAGPTTAPRPTSGGTAGGGALLVFFSRAGENYWNGGRRDLEVGSTEVLATMIAERTGIDLHRVTAADPYPHAYDETVARNVREQDEDARPQIAEPLPDLAGYGTVILASPIWNVRPPMIMSTFLDGVSLAGTTILPVTTHAMSGLGRAPEVYATLAPDAVVGEGLAVRGERVADAGPEIDRWVRAAGIG